ncbi:MAG: P-loop NTPase [Spirochaetales bacterium]|nr:P-loop NTPase [Spirochaetales bacterium]
MGMILPVASGKGGVGKTAITASLAASLAGMGKDVILVDLDLGASNMHTFLGVKNRDPGLGGYINKKVTDFESLMVPTNIPGLRFVSGDALLPGTANLNYFMKLKIMKAITNTSCDFIVLDLGAGTSWNVIDFFSMTRSGLVVTIPETTAILNAYSFLKFSLFRMIFRQFPSKGEERLVISEFLADRIEGTDKSFESLKTILAPFGVEAVNIVDNTLNTFSPRIVINRGKTGKDIQVGEKLRQIVSRNLKIQIEFIGLIPESPELVPSLFKGVPASVLYPDSQFARSIDRLSEKIAFCPEEGSALSYYEDADLNSLKNEYISLLDPVFFSNLL